MRYKVNLSLYLIFDTIYGGIGAVMGEKIEKKAYRKRKRLKTETNNYRGKCKSHPFTQ